MKNYFSFKGHASRSEYWGVQLVSILLLILIFLVIGFIGAALFSESNLLTELFFKSTLFIIAILWFWIFSAAAVKRTKDAGINPWWAAAIFIPYVGVIPWIVIGLLKSEKASNAEN